MKQLKIKMKKSFTLIELMVVTCIIAILSVIAFTGFGLIYEDNLDKEAKASLEQINAAESYYYMKNSSYYASGVISDINDNLKLALPTATSRNWSYTTDSDGCGEATRNNTGARTWKMEITDTDPVADDTCP